MTKLEFLDSLRKALTGLPLEDIERHVDYYKESIEDRMEDGLSEQEAVAAMGAVEDVAKDILAESPPPAEKKVVQKRKWGAWEILLLVLGFPLWFPLLMSVASVVLSVYLSLWAVVVSLYALPITLGVCSLAMGVLAVVGVLVGRIPFAVFALGACLITAGLCIFGFILCNLVAKFAVWCSKLLGRFIKSCFGRKEAKQ